MEITLKGKYFPKVKGNKIKVMEIDKNKVLLKYKNYAKVMMSTDYKNLEKGVEDFAIKGIYDGFR